MQHYVAHWKPVAGQRIADQDIRAQICDRKSLSNIPVKLLHSPASASPDDFLREQFYIPAERRVADLEICWSGRIDLNNGEHPQVLMNQQKLRHQALRKQSEVIISAGQKRPRQSGEGGEAEKKQKLFDALTDAANDSQMSGSDDDLNYGREERDNDAYLEADELDR